MRTDKHLDHHFKAIQETLQEQGKKIYELHKFVNSNLLNHWVIFEPLLARTTQLEETAKEHAQRDIVRTERVNSLETAMQIKSIADEKATVEIIGCIHAMEQKHDEHNEAQNSRLEQLESFEQDKYTEYLTAVTEITQKTNRGLLELKGQFAVITKDFAKSMACRLFQALLSERDHRIEKLESDVSCFETDLQRLMSSPSTHVLKGPDSSLHDNLAAVRASILDYHARLANLKARHANTLPGIFQPMPFSHHVVDDDDTDMSEDELGQPETHIDPRLKVGSLVKTIVDNHVTVIEAILPDGVSARIRWFVQEHGSYLRGRLKFPDAAQGKQLRAWWTQNWPMEDLMV
jgi:hypothetical protein